MINAIDHGPTAVELAFAVLRERYRSLSAAEQSDLGELLPFILGPDGEERDSAIRAANELLSPPTSSVQLLSSPMGSAEPLQSWLHFVSVKIRRARTDAGLTQAELAEKSGLPQSHISRLENGQHSPSAKTLEKIADALGLAMTEFDPSVAG